MKSELKTLHIYRDNIKTAAAALLEFIKNQWPVGSAIKWQHGNHIQAGVVTHVSSGGGGMVVLMVTNDKTGRNVRIYDYQIKG